VVTGDSPHPRAELGAVASRFEPALSSPAVPQPRSMAVASGHQRSAAVSPDLHQSSSRGGRTVLPKLAVIVLPTAPEARTVRMPINSDRLEWIWSLIIRRRT
jgi:hypothetical protein